MKSIGLIILVLLGLITPTNISSQIKISKTEAQRIDISHDINLLTQDIYHLNNELKTLNSKVEKIK